MTTYSRPRPDGEHKLLLLVFIILALIVSSLVSCTPHRMMGKFDKLADKCYRRGMDTVPPGWCAMHYPSVDRVVPGKVVYVPGKTIEKRVPGKTIVVDCDSVVKSKPTTVRVKVPCPDAVYEVRVDTFTRHDTVYRTDPIWAARLRVAEDAHSQLQGKYKLARNTGITALSICALLLAILVGGITGKLSHPTNWFK
jgi:hypothetical protein